jgi:O-antigen/teichoic acid export membrane protein
LIWGRALIRSREPGTGLLDPTRLRAAMAFGVKLWVANTTAILIYRFDVFLLNAYSGSAEAGYYAVAIAVTTALGVLPAALGNVLFPRLAALRGPGDEARRREVEDQAIRHTLLLLVISSTLLAAALPLLVEPVFGSEFGPALAPALILIPGAAALGLATTLYSALAGRGRPGYAMWIAVAITPPAIGLYFLLVPALEAEGAALGSDIAYIASAIVAALCLRSLSGPRTLADLLPGRRELRDYATLAHQVRHRLGMTAR